MENIKKYWLIGLLVVIAISMGIVKIRYRNVTWENAYPSITPTAAPTSAPEINLDYPLWELLPYAGNGFIIDRYSEPQVLIIKTKSINRKAITEEINRWLLENKIATESYKLIFEKEL